MIVDVYDLNLSKNSDRREQFEQYRHDIMVNTNIRNQNFTKQRFDIDKQLGTFLMIDREKDRIAAICAVFVSPVWPTNIARLFNRSYIDPDYRAKGLSRSDGVTSTEGLGKLGRWCQTFAYDSMIEVCKTNNIDVGVCTRENNGNSNAINLLLKNSRHADPNWNIKPNYYLTCQNENSEKCWQRLIYISLSNKDPTEVLSNIKQISSDEYTQRFLKYT